MLQELGFQEFDKTHALFAGFDYSLSIRSVLGGYNPGRIFVDNHLNPRLAFALTFEGYLLAGDSEDPASLKAMRQFFQDSIFTGKVFLDDDTNLSLAVHPQSWENKLPELIPTHEVEKNLRYHYLCSQVQYDWRTNLPEGYVVQRYDRSIVDDGTINDPGELIDFERIKIGWGSLENFLDEGVGFCVIHENNIVSWCSSDCKTNDQIDIGIATHPAHRRRGLATAAVAATVEHCLAKGFQRVGWHCNAINAASWKTAEKVGFVKNREYAYYFYIFDPVDHLAELGWHYYQLGEHDKTRQYYERVFAARAENPDYYYYLAASAWGEIGNTSKAIQYLLAAAERGWSALEHTQNDPDFRALHGTPEWQAILKRIEQNARAA
ncbi:MAG: GNAT family N-acetyltransferase [Chloroflexota bacterium]